MSKKMCKRIFSVILSLGLVMVQSMNVNAAGNEGLSAEQLNTLLEGMDSIVLQLEELGLNDSEINGLFQFTPREDNFYKVTQVKTASYTGSFVMEQSDSGIDDSGITTYESYNGNPPSSNGKQRQRIENIYGVALQYFHSDFYQGADQNGQDFGNYLTYLYLSHYIDGPGRAPTNNDLPYIISTDDIQAYNTFLSSANLSSWATALAGLGSAVYSDIDYVSNLNAINTVDQTLSLSRQDIAMAGVNGYNTKGAVESIASLIKAYFDEHYYTASDDEKLSQETFDYVSSQLEALNFYENFDENITKTITDLLITTFISVICSSVTLMGLCVSVIPLFVYEATGLIQTAVLVNLQYSFSGRYAVRTGIYLGF